jgi:hypothetical protein
MEMNWKLMIFNPFTCFTHCIAILNTKKGQNDAPVFMGAWHTSFDFARIVAL